MQRSLYQRVQLRLEDRSKLNKIFMGESRTIYWMNYGQDMSKKIQNKTTVNLVEPIHAPEVIARNTIQ